MKLQSTLFTALFLFFGLNLFSQVQVSSYNQIYTDICDNESGVVVVDSIKLYDPFIVQMGAFGSSDNPDFDLIYLGESTVNQDTIYFQLVFNHNTTPLGPVTVDCGWFVGGARADVNEIFNFTLHGSNVSFNGGSIGSFCENGDPIDLTLYATPSGGTFSGNGIINGTYLDPTNISNASQEALYVYTDPSNGCTDTAIWNFSGYITAAPEFSNITINDATACSNGDGSIDITPSGGSTSFEISTTNGDTISVLNGNSGTLTNLDPGSYFITLEDANGCQATDIAQVQSNDLSISGNIIATSCAGHTDGGVDVTINTSNNYTFYWEHGNLTDEDLSGVGAGDYTIYVTDDNGCQVSKTFTVTEPSGFQFDPYWTYSMSYGCSDLVGGSVEISVTGNDPYTYSFLPAGGTIVDDSVYTDLEPGDYTVEVTNPSGCTIDTVITVHGDINWDNYASLVQSTPSSCGGADGALNIQVDINDWTNLGNTYWAHGPTSEDLTGLAPGTYTYVIEHLGNTLCDQEFDFVVEAGAPMFNDICLITVDSLSSTNVIVWEKAQTSGVDHYNIYRETNNLGHFVKIGEVPYTDESIYNDVYASPLVKSWRYKISAVNDCGVESTLSAAHRTIHLRRDILGTDVDLNWNQYGGFTYADQDVWRFTVFTGWELIQTLPANQTSYTDTPPSLNGLDYAIEVAPASPCTSDKATSHNASRSNRSSGIFSPGDGLGTGSGNPGVDLDESINLEFSVYPNPSNGQFRLEFNQFDTYQIDVLSTSGQLIYSDQFIGVNKTVNINGLAQGMYLIKVQSRTDMTIEKIIINK